MTRSVVNTSGIAERLFQVSGQFDAHHVVVLLDHILKQRGTFLWVRGQSQTHFTQTVIPYAIRLIAKAGGLLQGRNLVNPLVQKTKHIQESCYDLRRKIHYTRKRTGESSFTSERFVLITLSPHFFTNSFNSCNDYSDDDEKRGFTGHFWKHSKSAAPKMPLSIF